MAPPAGGAAWDGTQAEAEVLLCGRMTLSRRAWLLAAGSVLGACSEPSVRELPAVSWEGENLRVATDVETPMCGGTAPYMDRLLGALGEQLGATPPGSPIYYLLDGDLDEYDTPCVPEAYGCSDSTAAYTHIAPFDHELVHLARSAIGFSYPLIEEGAAEYWGDDADVRGPLQGGVLDFDGEGALFPFPLYPRAGHFVAYLVNVHGDAAFEDLSLQTSFDTTLDEFRGVVRDVYGQELDELVTDYEASYPECPQREYRAAFGECTFAPARPLCDSDGPLVVRRRFSCGDEDVLGPRLGRQWTTIPIELESDGLLGFVFEANPATDVELTVRKCGGGCPPSMVGPLEPSETLRQAPFTAGSYVIEIEWPQGQELEVDLEFFGPCG